MARRFAILDCEDGELLWKKDTYFQLYSCLMREGDQWDVFYIAREGVVPEEEIMRKYQGIVITGSHYDARTDNTHQGQPWMPSLEKLIRSLVGGKGREEGKGEGKEKKGGKEGKEKEEGAVQVFASCFGCQIVTRAMGGEVGYNPSQKFTFGVEKVKILNEKAKEETQKEVWNLHEVHGDCVTLLPPSASLLASSSSCMNEVYKIGDNCLCFQSHPEFDTKIMQTVLFEEIKGELGEEERRRGAEGMVEAGVDDNVVVNQFIRSFLVGEGKK